MTAQRGKRSSQREFDQGHGAGGTCPEDGKSRYLDKAAAKRAIKRLPSRDRRMSAYRCGEFWHIGGTPAALKSGSITRDDLGPTRPREPYGRRTKNGAA